MTSQTVNIRDLIAPVYYPLHVDIKRHGHTFYNLPGGRGSAKSSFCGIEVPLGIMRDVTGKANALVLRKYAVTLRGSVSAIRQRKKRENDLWKLLYYKDRLRLLKEEEKKRATKKIEKVSKKKKKNKKKK